MFDNCSIMVLLNDGNENLVQLLEVDKTTQAAICSSFSDAAVPLLSDKQIVPFDGSYKPNDDECLSICNFHLPEVITDAVRNPLGLQPFVYNEEAEPDIRSILLVNIQRPITPRYSTLLFSVFARNSIFPQKNSVCSMTKTLLFVRTGGALGLQILLIVYSLRWNLDFVHISMPARYLTLASITAPRLILKFKTSADWNC